MLGWEGADIKVSNLVDFFKLEHVFKKNWFVRRKRTHFSVFILSLFCVFFLIKKITFIYLFFHIICLSSQINIFYFHVSLWLLFILDLYNCAIKKNTLLSLSKHHTFEPLLIDYLICMRSIGHEIKYPLSSSCSGRKKSFFQFSPKKNNEALFRLWRNRFFTQHEKWSCGEKFRFFNELLVESMSNVQRKQIGDWWRGNRIDLSRPSSSERSCQVE